MARFKVVTHQLQGASFGVSGGGYKLELEALAPIDAAIVEIPASTEDEFIEAAHDADAIIAIHVIVLEPIRPAVYKDSALSIAQYVASADHG